MALITSKCITMTVLLFFLRSVMSAMEGMIVGGQYARIEDFPHAAFLAINCVTRTESDNYSCGSSILNQVTLLTAAHCFEDCLSNSNIAVGVAVERKRSSLTHLVAVFTIHPKFHAKKVINDLALAKLSYSLVFSPKVKRVVLVKDPPYHEEAVVAGWGIVDEGKRMGTMYLKSAKQKIWKRKDCIAVLTKLNKGTICARGIRKAENYGYPAAKVIVKPAIDYLNASAMQVQCSLSAFAASGIRRVLVFRQTLKDSARHYYNSVSHFIGDSGSALMLRGYIQVGLVSVKYPQLSKSVIVFTHVPYFYNWIMKTSKKLYCMKTK